MLTFVDLHRETELSSADMSEVAGGISCDQAQAAGSLYAAAAGVFRVCGETDIAQYFSGVATGLLYGGCTNAPP